MDELNTYWGQRQLDRVPAAGKQPLRAWDAADELILEALSGQSDLHESTSILCVNDQFAALACALHQYRVTLYSDSFLTQLALRQNLSLNRLQNTIQFLPATAALEDKYDVVLIKIPKSLALLEHQLACIKPILSANTRVIAGGMIKYLEQSHIRLLERYLGAVSTSLAHKKARLVFVNALHARQPDSPFPGYYPHPQTGQPLCNHANVFSRSRVDRGSRLVLDSLHTLQQPESIIDMGCGNGILGVTIKYHYPNLVSALFVDESFMALESSRENWRVVTGSAPGADFIASHCFDQVPDMPVDLIVCNPPFHQANTLTDDIAWQMMKQGRQFLHQGGQLLLVGNRHLGYHHKLKKLYGNARVVASDSKFVVLSCTKR